MGQRHLIDAQAVTTHRSDIACYGCVSKWSPGLPLCPHHGHGFPKASDLHTCGSTVLLKHGREGANLEQYHWGGPSSVSLDRAISFCLLHGVSISVFFSLSVCFLSHLFSSVSVCFSISFSFPNLVLLFLWLSIYIWVCKYHVIYTM